MSGIQRLYQRLRADGDARYQGAQAGAELVVTSVERDSTGKVTTARGTIGGEGDFTVPMLGRETTEGDHLWVRYPAGQPATGVLEYVVHLASDQAGAGIVATNGNLPAPTFAAPWDDTTIEGSPGHIVARLTVHFNAVEAKYRPSGYTVSYRVNGEVWADVPVPHTGGPQSCRLPMGFPPGATVDVKLRARYNWNASESVESETRTVEVAADTASPGAALALTVDNTSPGALILTATGTVDSAFFQTWEYTVATSPTGSGGQNFRSPGQVTFAGPPGDYYVRVVPVSKAGVSGSPYPASGYAGPYAIPEYAGLDTTPPDAFAAAPELAARTVQLADGSTRAFLKVTLPAGYVFPPDYARTIVRLLETTSGNYQFWTLDGTAREIEQAIGFGTWQVDAVGEDVAGNRQPEFGPQATVIIAEPGLPANPADPVCVGTGLAILVTYAMPAGALRAEIERSTDNLGAGAVSLGTFDGTRHLDLLATDANTVVLPSYWYRIRGVNAAGAGAWSNRVQGAVLALHGSYLVADSVTAREVAANTITANEIAAGSITGDRIKAGDLGADRLNIASVGGRNYLLNPSLEFDNNPTDGTPDGWASAGTGHTMTVQGLDSRAYHGARSMHIGFTRAVGAPTNAYVDVYQNIAVAAGQTFTMSAWVKGESYVPGGGDGFYVGIAWFSASNAFLAQQNTAPIQTTQWQRLSITGTAPAGATRAYCFLRAWSDPNRAAGGTSVACFWDAAQLEAGGVLTDFDPRNVSGQGWTVSPEAIVGRDGTGAIQVNLDSDGTLRSGSRNVLIDRSGVTVYGTANQSDVLLKRDGAGRGILQAAGVIVSPVSGLTVPLNTGGQIITLPAGPSSNAYYLRHVGSPPDFGPVDVAAWVAQRGLTAAPWFWGWTNGSPASQAGLDTYVYMHDGKLVTSGTINPKGGLVAGTYVGGATLPYARGPLGVRQIGTLAQVAGSFQWMQDWALLTAGTNWATLSLFAMRQTDSIGGSNWSGTTFVLRPDIDNAGATGGWVKLGWYDTSGYWSLGRGAYTGLGDLYMGTEGAVHVPGALTKGSGTFEIPHPDPAKADTHNLRHSFVESPTRGDNLYRYRMTAEPGADLDLPLPDWWRHLNVLADDPDTGDLAPQVWVNAAENFGRGYARVSDDGRAVRVRVDTPGEYNVLVMATRGDPAARRGWDMTGGVEPPLRPEQRKERQEAIAE